MIHIWLASSPFNIFAALVASNFGLALFLWWLTYRSPLGHRIRRFNGVVAPLFSSVAVLFALLTGFLAVDIGDRSKQAHAQVQTEAGALHNLQTLSIAAKGDMRAIRAAIRDYVVVTASEEWLAMSQGEISPKAAAKYDALLREVSNPALTTIASAAVHRAMLAAAVEAGTARNARLALASDRTNHLKWLSVLILAVITQVAIGLVHVGQSGRVFIAGQTVFATAAVVALGIIALQETPFDGAFRTQPAPLEALSRLPIVPAPAGG